MKIRVDVIPLGTRGIQASEVRVIVETDGRDPITKRDYRIYRHTWKVLSDIYLSGSTTQHKVEIARAIGERFLEISKELAYYEPKLDKEVKSARSLT